MEREAPFEAAKALNLKGCVGGLQGCPPARLAAWPGKQGAVKKAASFLHLLSLDRSIIALHVVQQEGNPHMSLGASDAKSGIRFEISDLNYLHGHVDIDHMVPYGGL